MYEDRVAKAVEYFKQGYNCSQSVVAAFADMYGFTTEQAFKMSAAFGGGIGRMRETCGAACGLFMLAGLEKGAVVGSDQASKAETYALVQKFAEKLKASNGSINCGVMLGLRKKDNEAIDMNTLSPSPEARTEKYYKKRPCIKLVEQAAQMWANHLENE